MLTTEEIIGDIVFISFRDSDRYSDIGITQNCGHFMVCGYDNIGIWVSHPRLEIVHSEDENGRPLQTDKMYKEVIDANFLVSWDNVKTIMHYPGRDGFDFPSEFDKNIGFIVRKRKK